MYCIMFEIRSKVYFNSFIISSFILENYLSFQNTDSRGLRSDDVFPQESLEKFWIGRTTGEYNERNNLSTSSGVKADGVLT